MFSDSYMFMNIMNILWTYVHFTYQYLGYVTIRKDIYIYCISPWVILCQQVRELCSLYILIKKFMILLPFFTRFYWTAQLAAFRVLKIRLEKVEFFCRQKLFFLFRNVYVYWLFTKLRFGTISEVQGPFENRND